VLDALLLSALLLSGASTATPPAPPAAPAAPHAAEPEAKPPPAPGAEPSAADRGALPAKPAGQAQEKPAGQAQEKAPGEAPGAEAPPAHRPRPARSGAEGAAAPARTYTAVPPALSSRALLEELRRTSKDRQSEQASLAQQAQKLQALQQDIERSRAALRDETAHLQALVAAAAKAPREPGHPPEGKGGDTRAGAPKAGAKPEPTPLETLAKTARGMKPDQAAAMMAQLDRGLAASILDHMKPAEAALVLEKMEPATSAALVALLARKDRT
jgi:flagellar motility protein MotE (MotC chaperone)